MNPGLGRFLTAAIFLTVPVAEARSQVGYGYYPGYGAYGWGGWTGTVPGNLARGLGYFNMAAGAYNRQTAVANAINADTVMRWNQYWYLAQQEANRRAYLRRARERERNNQAYEALQRRLLEDPTLGDVESGDALNATLDLVSDPAVSSSAVRMASDALSGKVVRDIPFFSAPQAATINLRKLAAEGAWPAALQGPGFASDRADYRRAADAALSEAVDRDQDISPGTLRELRGTLGRIRARLDANPPEDRVELARARDFLKTLTCMSRLLDRPRFEKMVADLAAIDRTTLGHLLGFMQVYNLRFGRATTPRQREVYRELYPKLAALRDRLRGESGKPGPAGVDRGIHGEPGEFFKGMDLGDQEAGG